MALDAKNAMIRKLTRAHLADNRPLTQVDRLLLAFGGVPALLAAIRAVGGTVSKVTVYRWNYPTTKGGSAGVLPSRHWPVVLAAARLNGILLTAEHLDPRPNFGETAREVVAGAKGAGDIE